MNVFELGKVGQCTVTGFEGIITARTDWLNGCVRYGLQPPVDKDGKVPEAYWVDHDQLKYVEHSSKEVTLGKPTGGPMPNPKRVVDPQ